MFRSLLCALSFLSAFTFYQESALAQDKTTVRDHRSSETVRDHRTQKAVRDHRTKSVLLTKGECTQLGGDVKETGVSICGSAEYCSRVGEDGTIYRVCISQATKASTSSSSKGVPRPSRRPTATAGGSAVAVPLTTAECEGLGGVVRNATECGVVKKACITTDQSGVIRTACINKATE